MATFYSKLDEPGQSPPSTAVVPHSNMV